MAEQTEVECEQDGCTGVRLDAARACLAHASEEEVTAALKLIGETGEIDARGVPITDVLLQRILAAAPRGENEEPLLKACMFDRATFSGSALFERVTFRGGARFDRATFTGGASFGWATFTGGASFGWATFTGDARFDRATFTGDASFHLATFSGGARFERATFTGGARFDRATFTGDTSFHLATFRGDAMFDIAAGFDGATFSGDAWFSGATFTGDASFHLATFSGGARFERATFTGDAWFDDVKFERARRFGPVLAGRELVLDGAQFAQPVQIEASAGGVCCRRARFPGGVQFRLRWALVALDDTDLAAPSILAGIPRLSDGELAKDDEKTAKAWRHDLGGEFSGQPQLVSLRRADVAGFGLSNVSVADCRFADAHNLDKLRLESDVSFEDRPPPGWGRWSGAGRQVIAEERAWRAHRSRRWAAPMWPAWLGDPPGPLDRGQIAGLYRALRKGREDAKDEPGAADFYYGEMEMRRHARRTVRTAGSARSGQASRGRVERGILTAYWLVSGYGLRAWRALACLTAVTALLALAFHFVGFAAPPQPVSYWTSLLYAFRATLSLTDDQVKLTAWGELLQGVLRLTGPVLLGLALLALRGRVKR
jgi:hypothetical protein